MTRAERVIRRVKAQRLHALRDNYPKPMSTAELSEAGSERVGTFTLARALGELVADGHIAAVGDRWIALPPKGP